MLFSTTPPTPLNDAPLGGFFIGKKTMKFEKPPRAPRDLIGVLKQRGLVIDDEDRAQYYLENIGYYRLSAYFSPFQNGGNAKIDHQFQDGTNFESVLALYIFDRQIRLHIIDALERIEVALRSNLGNTLSLKKGAHWYLDPDVFYSPVDHANIVSKIANDTGHHNGGRKSSDAVRHYYKKYTEPPLPPSWVIMEELSIGALSRVFKQIRNEHKQEISSLFRVSNDVLESWFHSLTVLRNKCAHHSRTWNSTYPSAKVPRKGPKLGIKNAQKLQGLICITKYMVEKVSGDTEWHSRLIELLKTCPISYEEPMGYV